MLSQTTKKKTGKKGHHNCPTALPNKKGEDRKEWPLLGIDHHWIAHKKEQVRVVKKQSDCSPPKKEKTGKKGHQWIFGLISHKKGPETGKGGRDGVDWLTALPNKKGEDRKERPLVAIDCQIDC